MKTDLDHFNERHADAPAIELSFNFEPDLAEAGFMNFSSANLPPVLPPLPAIE